MSTVPVVVHEVKGKSISQVRRHAAQFGFHFSKRRDLSVQLFRFRRKRISRWHEHLTVVERAIIGNMSLSDVEDLCGLLDKTMLHWHATRERGAR